MGNKNLEDSQSKIEEKTAQAEKSGNSEQNNVEKQRVFFLKRWWRKRFSEEHIIFTLETLGVVYAAMLLVFLVSLNMLIRLWFRNEYDYYTRESLLWLVVPSFVIGGILFILIHKYEFENKSSTRQEKLALLIKNTCSGHFINIFYVLAFLLILDWIPDSVFEYIRHDNSILSCVVYICGLPLLVWGKPTLYKKTEPNDNNRKLLVTGLSSLNPFINNIKPFIQPLIEFNNIEKVIVCLSGDAPRLGFRNKDDFSNFTTIRRKKSSKSDEKLQSLVAMYYDILYKYDSNGKAQNNPSKDDCIANLKALLPELVLACDPTLTKVKEPGFFVFTEGINYNDFKDCNDKIVKVINIEGKGYRDDEIVVNITPGTVMVSSAMTLNAIKGERLMAYVDQKTKKMVKDQTPSVSLIQVKDWKQEWEDAN